LKAATDSCLEGTELNFIDTNSQNTRHGLHRPIPGYWYSNIVGHLQQVRAVLHEDGVASRLVLENISGKRQTLRITDWYQLDLTLHSPGIERRRRRGDCNDPGEKLV